ncbi:hypothetical protein HDG42_004917 [Paraburkholderia sp. JPY171]|nr:hypothetical protein [Paraburkholderia atlantica]
MAPIVSVEKTSAAIFHLHVRLEKLSFLTA